MLTSLEIETARLVRYGYTNEQIAHEQGVKRGTVRSRLCNIYRKLGISSQSALFSMFLHSASD